MKIFELIEVNQLIEKKKGFLEKSFNTIEETLFFEIEKNKLDNNFCIRYLINNLEKYKEIIKGHLSLLKLCDCLDLSKIGLEFINIFKEAKVDEYFKSINKIIEKMIIKTNNLDEIYIIFQLFYENINQSYNQLKETLVNKFNNFFNLPILNNKIDYFSNIMIGILKLTPNISENLLSNMEKIINLKCFILIYLNIMNHFKEQERVKQHILF